MKTIRALILFATSTLVLNSCSKKDEETDNLIFSEIGNSTFTYYVGTPTPMESAGNSPHGFVRVKYNAIAFSALDSSGKIPPGAGFPDGSLIVKDIYSSATGNLTSYAVMKKSASSKNAGNGYLWAEFKSDGSNTFSTAKKGDGCIGCHSGSTNRDLNRIFDLR